MITEQELKADCTPEIIKKMVELAEGFEIGYSEIHRCDCVKYKWEVYDLLNFSKLDIIFPLLIHRAVEGWNKINDLKIRIFDEEIHTKKRLDPFAIGFYQFKNYQPQSLTQAECAMLHCLLDVFETGGEG